MLFIGKLWRIMHIIAVTAAVVSAFDLSETRVQYIVGYTHLDTQWRWRWQKTLDTYIPNTLKNLDIMDSVPGYVHSFEGAWRYMAMKQKYPAQYARLVTLARVRQWGVSGLGIDAMDVIIPSPEALVRQFLYSSQFYKAEFGYSPIDLLLPDCFGFGYALPTVAAHCGIKGFSTQKAQKWGCSVPIPFSIGRWVGVDGSSVVACLKPGDYYSSYDIRNADIDELGAKTGVWAAYDYMGYGDQGGPIAISAARGLLDLVKQNGTARTKVIIAPSDQIFRDLTPAQVGRLQAYNGELLLTTHGTGCYTSRGDLKLLNRTAQEMGLAAECASAVASSVAGFTYPHDKIRDTWISFLWHQMHDDLTGTCRDTATYLATTIPDYKNAITTFKDIQNQAISAIANKAETNVSGTPLIVFNSLGVERECVVDTIVASTSAYVRVYDISGLEVPSQCTKIGSGTRVVFTARIPSAGYAVFDFRQSSSPCALATGLKASANSIESNTFRVRLNSDGDISSIYNKKLGRELLSSPIRLALFNDTSTRYPQWEILYKSISAGPLSHVSGSSTAAVVDSGAARVTISNERPFGASTVKQYVSLDASALNPFVKLSFDINWQEYPRLLKAVFPVSATNDSATYDLGLGVVRRGNNTTKLYEVPAQQWADISDISGSHGVSIVNNCKYGWDKPDNRTLRLTLVRSPTRVDDMKYHLDKGPNVVKLGIYGHAGSWQQGKTIEVAQSVNRPIAVQFPLKHTGVLPSSYSFMSVSENSCLMALKKAEQSDQIIARVNERNGGNQKIAVRFKKTISSCSFLNGIEENIGAGGFSADSISMSVHAFEPKTIAVSLSGITGIRRFANGTSAFRAAMNQPRTRYTLAGAILPARRGSNGGRYTGVLMEAQGLTAPGKLLKVK